MKHAGLSVISSAILSLLLTGCISMTPGKYMVSPEAKEVLQKYQGNKFAVTQVTGPAQFDSMCRAVGNVTFDEGMTLAQFVAKGFNDELKYAGVHGDNGVKLKGTITKAAFSSSAAVVNGWWDLGLALESSNGKSMAVENRYEFEAGFVGAAACNNTSRAVGPAVQQLVRKVVADPRFADLVR